MPAKKTSSPNSTKITSQSNRYSILQSEQFNKDYVTITNLTKKPLEHSKTSRTIPNLRKSVSNPQTPSKAENYSTVNSKTKEIPAPPKSLKEDKSSSTTNNLKLDPTKCMDIYSIAIQSREKCIFTSELMDIFRFLQSKIINLEKVQ